MPRGRIAGAGLLATLTVLFVGAAARAQPRETWKGQPGDVAGLAVSPDGKALASSTLNGKEVALWDLPSGKKTATLTLDPKSLLTVAEFTPDGKSLVTVAATLPKESGQAKDFMHSAQVWDLASQKVRLNIDFPEDFGGGMITPDGKSLIAVGWGRGKVLLYDLSTGKGSEPLDLDKDFRGVTRAELSPDGKTLAVSTGAGGFLLWDVQRKAARARVPRDQLDVPADVLAFSPDGKTLASSGGWAGGVVDLWDAGSGKRAGKVDVGPRVDGIEALAFSPDGKSLAVGGRRWGVGLWDLAAAGERDDFEGDLHAVWVRCLAFTPDGKTLISGGWDKDKAIWLWDVPQGRPQGLKPAGQLTPAEAKQLKDLSH